MKKFLLTFLLIASLIAPSISTAATLGKTSIGGSTQTMGGEMYATKFTPTEAGTMNSISAYLDHTSGNDDTASVAVYLDDGAGAPGDLLCYATTEQVIDGAGAGGGAKWYTFSSLTAVDGCSFDGTEDLWLVIWPGFAGLINLYYDSGASGQHKLSNNYQTYWTWRDPFGTVVTTQSREASIYIDYTPTASIEQEGFAFGDDDGNEASHTLDTQDTDVTEALGTKTLRVLLNTPDDPSANAYKLKYQKNGAGGYVDVPTTTTYDVTPSPTSSNATNSGNDTASSSWTTVAVPNASTGDLLIFCLSWDDSTATTTVTAPSGQNGETLTAINATPAKDSSTETRSKCWYTIATGSWTAGNLTFTPNASEQWTASTIRVPSGEFDSTTPIGTNTTFAATITTSKAVQGGSMTAGSSDGGGRLFVWTSADADPQTVSAGYTQVANVDRGAVSGGLFTRDTIVTDSESISAATVSTIASDSWSSVSFIVRPNVLTSQVYISPSANVTGGGEATTARLTAPSGKTTSDFDTGRRWDDENGIDTIDITAADYTEVEWVLTTQSPATSSDYFDFRVYNGNTALATYTDTPRWTIGSGASSIKVINSLTKASVKLINGLANASMKSWNGVQ